MSEKKGPKRIRELAKELGISSKTIIDILKEAGYDVRSPYSKINLDMENLVREKISSARKEAEKDLEQKKKIYEKLEAEEKPKPRRLRRKPQKEVQKQPKEERKEAKVSKPRKVRKIKKKQKKETEEQEQKVLSIPGAITVSELATIMGKEPAEIIQFLFSLGIVATVNQTINPDIIELVAENFGYKVEFVEDKEEVSEEEKLEEYDYIRPPIVTIMGHVDHGKTTLLDAIRKSRIAEGEVGRITQSIGAYQINYKGEKITFIDTPGHEAFTSMRARGAQVTDIVILVVDGKEGVKEQTIEALNHARAAGVKIIVAITKMDLPDANPELVKRQLSEHGLIPDEWGGDTIFVPVSAYTGQGLEDLIDAILVVAEEIADRRKTTKEGKAKGVVLESGLERNVGKFATLIVQRGTLKLKDVVVAGFTYGRVRRMLDDWGKDVKEALPGDPVKVYSFEEVPRAGDKFEVVDSLNEATKIVEERRRELKVQLERGEMLTLAQKIRKKIEEGEVKEVPIILKAENYGKLEAIKDALSKMEFKKVKPVIIHSGVGDITESDLLLAEASEGVVIGFQVKLRGQVRKYAQKRNIPVKLYDIIYHLLDDMKDILASVLEPEYKEELLGRAEVKAIFKVKGGRVAGCYVVEGVIRRDADKVRLVRNGEVVFEGKIESLRHFQDDVQEVKAGMECGIKLKDFKDFKEGDMIEAYRVVKVEPQLV